MNVLDLLQTNQTQGTPTLAGAGEGKILTTSRSILDIFGKAAEVVTTAKNGFEGRDPNGARSSEPGQTPGMAAKSFLTQYGLWIGVGLAALIGIVIISRR